MDEPVETVLITVCRRKDVVLRNQCRRTPTNNVAMVVDVNMANGGVFVRSRPISAYGLSGNAAYE